MTAEMRRGSRALMPTSGLAPGEALYATDRQALYAAKDDGAPAPAVIAVDELVALVGSGVVSGQDYVLIHDADATGVKEKKILVSELLVAMGAVPSGQLGQPNGVATLGPDGKVPTAQLPDAVLGALRYQGTWNASTNSPAIPAASSGNRGHYYVVSTAGSTAIDGESDWQVGDWLVSSGTSWGKVDNSDKVRSVAGKTGVVTLVKGDVGLGNVDNTSDANKPVSTAQQAALDAKQDSASAWNTTNNQHSLAAAAYQKFASGFIEQCGGATVGGESAFGGVYYAYVDITFPTPFTSTNYRVTGLTDRVTAWVSAVGNKTTTGCRLYVTSTLTGKVASAVVDWQATGY